MYCSWDIYMWSAFLYLYATRLNITGLHTFLYFMLLTRTVYGEQSL